MTETVIHGRVQTPQIDYSDVPMAYWPSRNKVKFPDGRLTLGPVSDKVSAVCRSMADCDDLVHWFGNQATFCPVLPILLMIPDNITVVSGLGFSTVAELRDCCCEVWGVKTGVDAHKRFDNDEIRERLGMARKEDLTEMTREAFHERRKRHMASPVTDPVKQWTYPNPTQRTLHKTPDSQEWKDN